MNNKIEIYTDGSCILSSKNGGWAAILLYKEHYKEIFGSSENTTNNKMELQAVIEGLKAIKKIPSEIIIYTDSQYVQNGITEWIFNWKKNNWKSSAKKDVKNIELWKELDIEASKHHIEWQWVKAHNGNKYNEMVDSLALKAAKNTNK